MKKKTANRMGGDKLFPFLAEMSSSRSDDIIQTTAPGDNCISRPFLRTKKDCPLDEGPNVHGSQQKSLIFF